MTWPKMTLSAVTTKVGSGATPRGGKESYHQTGIPLIRSQNVRFEGFDRDGLVFLDNEQAGDLDGVIVQASDVLLNITGASIGRVTVAPEDLAGARVNQHVCIVRPQPSLLPRFLSHYLASPSVQAFIMAEQSGVTRQALTKSKILDFEVPVPTVDTQHAIVAAIDSHFSRLNAATATLERVQRNLERYRASVLKAAVEGRLVPTEAELAKKEGRTYEPASVLLKRILTERRRRWEEAELAKLTAKGKKPTYDKWKAKYEEPAAPDVAGLPELPEGWCWASAESVCSVVASGSTPKAPDLHQGAGEVPFIKVYNLTFSGTLNFSVAPTFIDRSVHEGLLARSRVRPGDVLTNIVGPPLGKVSVAPSTHPEWNINQAIVAFRPLCGVSNQWLAAILRSSPAQHWLLGTSKTTTSQVNLAVTNCRRLPIPLCPEAEQERIVAEVARQVSIQQDAATTVGSRLKSVARLRQSILKWAFEGRLVGPAP